MKSFARIASALVLMTAATGVTFAAPAEQTALVLNHTKVADQTTVGSVDVPVTNEIRAWFAAKSVDGYAKSKGHTTKPNGDRFQGAALDGSKIDAPLNTLTAAEKATIDAVIADDDLRDSLEALIKPALKAALVRGQVEVATMQIGRHVWTMSLEGPEDRF